MSSTPSINSSYRGSKRAACDRCREHKSRCPREGPDGRADSAKCARCAKAGAVCSFSLSLRSGRDSSSTSKIPAKRKESKSSSEELPWTTISERKDEDETAELAMGVLNQNEFLTSSPRVDGFPTRTGVSLGDDLSQVMGSKKMHFNDAPDRYKFLGPYNDHGLTGFLAPAHMDVGDTQYPMEFEPFVNSLDWSLNQMQGVNTHGSTHSPVSNVVANSGQNNTEGETPALFSVLDTDGMHEASCMEMDMSCEDGSSVPQLTSSVEMAAISLMPRLRNGKDLATANGNQTSSNSLRLRITQDSKQKPCPLDTTPTSHHNVQHQRMSELSELGMILYSQGMVTNPEDDSNPIDLSLPNCLAAKVLESSVKFLDLLTSLYSFETSSPKSSDEMTPANPNNSSDEEMSTILDDSESDLLDIPTDRNKKKINRKKTPADRDHASKSMPAPGEGHSSSSRTGSCDSKSPPSGNPNPPLQPMDMTEVFSLITCYIRLLHLHGFFYSRLSDFLIASVHTPGARLAPVFPGLQIGSLSLDGFAKFQVKFLVQISTHVLGKIETALGLPDGYRISKKDCEHRGILDDSSFVQFVEMALKDKETQRPRLVEEDRFASVNNRLSRLRHILKGAIR